MKRIDEEIKKRHILQISIYGQCTHYQILLIILLKKFIKLNVNMAVIIENVKRFELNTNAVSAVLNT